LTELAAWEREAALRLAARRDFRAALAARAPAIIAEIKKASPSKGVLSRIKRAPKATIPANLCLFLRRIEFPGFDEDFDEAAGNASEQAA
jgi:hypothetical protein